MCKPVRCYHLVQVKPVPKPRRQSLQHRTKEPTVTALDAYAALQQYKALLDTTDEGPDVLGVGRYLVRPTLIQVNLDMLKAVDSLSQHKRAEDIRATIVNVLRQAVYQAYQQSEYKAASDATQGGNSVPPTVIIATDQIIEQWLKIEGDVNTLGNGFNTRVVSTLDKRMYGQLFAVFGQFGQDLNAGPCPLHFGTRGWKPEVVAALPISRNNTISKELTVQPAWLHFMNCPVMVQMTITNLSQVVQKLSIGMYQVAAVGADTTGAPV